MTKIQFIEYDLNPNLKVAIDLEKDYGELEGIALQYRNEEVGIVFCGLYGEHDSYRLFLSESFSALELISIFNVGAHNVGRAELVDLQVKKIRAQMAAIYAKYPFRPYLIDQAGYKCYFTVQITVNDALHIDSIINEGSEAMFDEAEEEDWDASPVAGWIYKHQGIHLWWD
jgi:hypothetical protein